jgi:hypothetical protein
MANDADSAWIAAGASLVVALISGAFTMWNTRRTGKMQREQAATNASTQAAQDEANRQLARLNARLSTENDAAKARRDYEYEARKRLYAELYPLSFQLQERAVAATHRIMNLARATRDGHLAPGVDNWLTGKDSYYFNSVIHSLIAPLAVYELMTRKLTQFDLKLDPDLHRQHFIARLAYQAFRSDFDLADQTRYPPIVFRPKTRKYDPPEDRPATMDGGALEERWRWRQGLYSGQVGQVVDAMLSGTGPKTEPHTIDYAEFAKVLSGTDLRSPVQPDGSSKEMKQALEPMIEVFRDFHPARRPVTWRILLAQAACYRAIAAMAKGITEEQAIIEAARISSAGDEEAFDWIGTGNLSRPPGLPASTDLHAEQRTAIETANRYVSEGIRGFSLRYAS